MREDYSRCSVSVGDVLKGMLIHWKLILICAIVGLLGMSLYLKKNYDARLEKYKSLKAEYDRVMGAYTDDCDFVRKYNALPENEQAEAAKKQSEVWRAALTGDQLSVVENALEIKGLINKVHTYLETSILMSLDPYNVPTLTMIYEVSAKASANVIAQRYATHMAGVDAVNSIMTGIGLSGETDSSLYTELFTCTNSSAQFTITVQYTGKEQLEKIKEQVNKEVQNYTSALQESSGEHEIKVVQQVISVKTNNTITTTKNTLQNQITNYNNQLISLKNTFAKVPNQLRLYNYESDLMDGGSGYCTLDMATQPTVEEPGTVRSKKTYTLLGILVGIMVGCFIVYIKMLFSAKLQKADEMSKMYGVNVLGHYFGAGLTPVDNAISKLCHRSEGPTKDETCLEYIANNLQKVLEKENKKSVAFIYTTINKNSKKSLKELSNELHNRDITVFAMGDIRKSAKMVADISASDAVVVVETLNRSYYRSIEQELVTLKLSDQNVVGAIVIE